MFIFKLYTWRSQLVIWVSWLILTRRRRSSGVIAAVQCMQRLERNLTRQFSGKGFRSLRILFSIYTPGDDNGNHYDNNSMINIVASRKPPTAFQRNDEIELFEMKTSKRHNSVVKQMKSIDVDKSRKRSTKHLTLIFFKTNQFLWQVIIIRCTNYLGQTHISSLLFMKKGK